MPSGRMSAKNLGVAAIIYTPFLAVSLYYYTIRRFNGDGLMVPFDGLMVPLDGLMVTV